MFAMFFAFWRIMEIITLIPAMGMLAWFVNGWNSANILTPPYVLVLFIVSVLALAWAMFTLFTYHRSSANALFVAFIDLCFVGAFIAGVYYLRWIGDADCSNVRRGDTHDLSLGIFGSASVNGITADIDKPCAMLKASWAFGIMNCIFFFFTAVLAFFHGGRLSSDSRGGKTYYRETHHHRHSHRGSRSPSHRSHSHRRVYV